MPWLKICCELLKDSGVTFLQVIRHSAAVLLGHR